LKRKVQQAGASGGAPQAAPSDNVQNYYTTSRYHFEQLCSANYFSQSSLQKQVRVIYHATQVPAMESASSTSLIAQSLKSPTDLSVNLAILRSKISSEKQILQLSLLEKSKEQVERTKSGIENLKKLSGIGIGKIGEEFKSLERTGVVEDVGKQEEGWTMLKEVSHQVFKREVIDISLSKGVSNPPSFPFNSSYSSIIEDFEL
jgi:hypothetical protein